MTHMLKIADYLKILTDERVKDLVVVDFGECYKSTGKTMYSKLSQEKNLRKTELFYT